MYLGTAKTVACEDGNRQTIDVRAFNTEYWTYALTFKASINKKGSLEGKLIPQILQRLSTAQQQLQEFQKWLVHSFNACAITKSQYASFGVRFQTLDGLARQIGALANNKTLSSTDQTKLDDLVKEYIRQSNNLAKENG